jgi:hypothetical protein
VGDLTVQLEKGRALLQFSGDEERSYIIEASPDLINWEPLGAAKPDAEQGNFYYEDESADQVPAQYYRVLTQ